MAVKPLTVNEESERYEDYITKRFQTVVYEMTSIFGHYIHNLVSKFLVKSLPKSVSEVRGRS